MTLKLHGLERAAPYAVIDYDSKAKVRGTGARLKDIGIEIHMLARPQATLFTYARA